jgi:glycosyltransferase involved in cell wall biosynthesis
MLTVLLATRNGGRILPAVLECFTRLQTPSTGWKLVVIDNGSTDLTSDIIASFQRRLPLTYRFEPRLGKNAALNRGLADLEGDLAIFTDDDVFPQADWLVRLRAAADSHPQYSMFGGVILPRWESGPPYWLNWAPAGPVFTLTDPLLTEGPTDPGNLYGPNMAIRGEVFKSGTRFDTSIGPRGANYAMGSESELVERLGRQGHKAWHVHDALVEHFIRDYQTSKSWVLRRAVRFGRGQLRLLQAAEPAAVPSWLGVPARVFPRMLKRGIRMARAWLSSNEQEMFSAQWEFNYLLGHVLEARPSRRDRSVHTDDKA